LRGSGKNALREWMSGTASAARLCHIPWTTLLIA
jgi:hypothetical protein